MSKEKRESANSNSRHPTQHELRESETQLPMIGDQLGQNTANDYSSGEIAIMGNVNLGPKNVRRRRSYLRLVAIIND